jgi:KRAB domain-containing zinc finger protein
VKPVINHFLEKISLQGTKKTIYEIDQIYQCNSCDFSTTRKDSLNRHIIEVHEKIRAHICELCGKRFSQAKSLRRHINSIHTQKEKYACLHCDSFFFREDNFQRHVQTIMNWKSWRLAIKNKYFMKTTLL